MALKTTKTNSYTIEVTRAHDMGKGKVAFDMLVNGINIYGCWYIENGAKGAFVAFPQQKSTKDNKYYKHCYFPLTEEHVKGIEEQLNNLL